MKYYLAVDIGASGGRHILSHMEDGRIVLEEVYRFENGMTESDGHLTWDYAKLWQSILAGMKACRAAGKIPVSMGIDTWAVDYVLLNQAGQVLGKTYAYRDSRTTGMLERLSETLPFAEHYALTGIAYQPFNTIYQLMATPHEELARASRMLMVPDYFHYLLTGRMMNEYTNASTTGLLDPVTRDWSCPVLKAANLPEHLFVKPVMPGTTVGPLTKAVADEVGFQCKVVLPATHDTGSAFMAVPALNDTSVYLSSGTWSLLGVENAVPLTGEDSMNAGFTNEGGHQGCIRFLKNIMGMWMLQCIRRELDKRYTYAEMAAIAAKAQDSGYRVDVADNRFLAPISMTCELEAAVREQGGGQLPLPQMLRLVHQSLADGYAKAIAQMETITGIHYDTIHIVGGGSQNVTLNQMTADACHRPVIAGPTEGTALGNLMAQMIADGVFADLADARRAERDSFPVTRYDPR